MLRDSNTAGLDNMRKSIYGFPLVPYIGMGLRLAALRASGAPLKTFLVIFVNNYLTTLLFFVKYLMSLFNRVFFFLFS